MSAIRSLAAALVLSPAVAMAEPRVAVMSAFAPELVALEAAIADAETQTINGNRFVTGTLEGQAVVMVLSGVSLINAAMTTQLLLDRFEVETIVFSGIAGGVNPALNIGDVVVAARWGTYLDVVMARETADGFETPPFLTVEFPGFGMIHTRTPRVQSARGEEPEQRFWFDSDPDLLALAETVAAETELAACNDDGTCLGEPPRIVVGGNGVSGAAFVDNADLRDWAHATFDAQVLDMESSAVAHVAYAN
ncbi:MAG: 5'-methylthioadenosine/S-adenosylhomocysteine nucleosidase, partial [Pseudomonadota bacterium]